MDVLSISATIFGFVAIAGGAAGYFKASRGDSIIKYQSTEIALRDAKVTNLEKDLAAVSQSSDAKDATIIEVKKHNEYLQKLGQGSPELIKLAQVQQKLITSIDNQTRAITAFIGRQKK